MNVLAAIRPDDFNVPLLLHVVGAMILVGAVTAAVGTLLTPGGGGDPAGLRRFAFRVLLIVGIPAYIVMRIGAEWLYDKEFGDLPEGVDEPGWVGVGYITADLGLLVLLVATACAGFASRRSSAGLGKAAGILGAILLVGWVIAIWAMGAKPD
jgi:hypothetical protein